MLGDLYTVTGERIRRDRSDAAVGLCSGVLKEYSECVGEEIV